ncbi:MAG: hypothetical protein ACFFDI_19055 [Promethearchaeota archaeon]
MEPNLTTETIIRTIYDHNIAPVREEDLNIMGKIRQCVVTEIDWSFFNMTRWYDKKTGLVVKILSHDMRHTPHHLVITETLQTPWPLGFIPILGLISILRSKNRKKRKFKDTKI